MSSVLVFVCFFSPQLQLMFNIILVSGCVYALISPFHFECLHGLLCVIYSLEVALEITTCIFKLLPLKLYHLSSFTTVFHLSSFPSPSFRPLSYILLLCVLIYFLVLVWFHGFLNQCIMIHCCHYLL